MHSVSFAKCINALDKFASSSCFRSSPRCALSSARMMRSSSSQGSAERVLVIAGPTAVGKSAAAMTVANKMSGEIVSADSVQVYRYLDIGANKPSLEERQQVVHHLVDVADPAVDDYTAGQFYIDSRDIISNVLKRDKLPIVVGGTSMYMRWLVYGKPPTIEASPEVRAAVEKEVSKYEGSWDEALKLLSSLDPQRASTLSRNDWYRLKRSLEIIRATNRTVTELPDVGASPASKVPDESPFDFRCVFLVSCREALARRVDERCELMLVEKKLLDEVTELLAERRLRLDSSPARAIGYRQVIDYLLARAADENREEDAKLAFRKFLDVFMSSTRQYARRQMQWFRSDANFLWIDVDSGQGDERLDPIEDIQQVLTASREGYLSMLSSPNQIAIRERYKLDGKDMKRYIAKKHLIVPGSDIEQDLIATAEAAAARIRSSGYYNP